LTLQRCSKISP